MAKSKSKKKTKQNRGTLVIGLLILAIIYLIQTIVALQNDQVLSDVQSFATMAKIWYPENSSTMTNVVITLQIVIIFIVIDLIVNSLFALMIVIVSKLINVEADFIVLLTIFIWLQVLIQGVTLLLGGSIIYFFIILLIAFLYGLGIISFDKKLL